MQRFFVLPVGVVIQVVPGIGWSTGGQRLRLLVRWVMDLGFDF